METNKLNILIVDDDDVAIESFQRGVRHAKLPFSVTEAEDAIEAYAILKGIHPQKKINSPCVVLLDINMPRMSGFEFLETIRLDEKLCFTSVFILTTSDLPADKEKASELDVEGYITKNSVGPRFKNLLEKLINYANH
jgi:CheY-like chemotaxis protein